MAKQKVKRVFNYLNRYRINESSLDIEAMLGAGERPMARISRIDLPEASDTQHDPGRWLKATVVVEAWQSRSASLERLDLGTVGNLSKRLRKPEEMPLPEFQDTQGIVFRVKVVAADNQQLLAEAERLSARGELPPMDTDELIPVRQDPALGEEPWRLHWDDDEGGPVVLVSGKLNGSETFLNRNGSHVAATVPEVMRCVLFRLGLQEDLREHPWAKKWLNFASRFGGGEPPAGELEWAAAEKWANGVVSNFCERNAVVTKANASLTEAGISGEQV